MVITSLDLDKPGKQQGFLQVPYSHNLGGWANVMIPITIVSGGKGPTVLALGGNHGDEYQGQIAIMKLARELGPGMVKGRVILIPSLNFPAARAATRLSPVDGMNMNRAFPGDAEGHVTSQIAHYLRTVLFPISDVVIDIHSGGRSMEFVPCAHMHLVSDREQRAKMFAAMLAWGTEFCFIYADIAGTGLLPVEAENQGKLVVTTELGGGECIPASVHRIAQSGLRNVLTHVGALKGREKVRKAPPIITKATNREDYILAPESGIFEVCVDLGTKVKKGQIVGYIHHLERPDRAPEEIITQSAGYLITMRAPCLTQQGDCVAVIARRVSESEVLHA
ncbi:MAG: succinylglutamate desuccinylase/aspartoacylase family protein [Verrucomicrobiales bacterium]|nr:succinylglutamate desuccinylase/aspartoacylase family protein [Verrucomicrobiales bacterium]MCP5558349.1 succinylglutamate desuccinylase/aspartoacylase family protein [Verrucomicrobiaceae bacterium]